MSRSVAVSLSSFLAVLMRTFERMGMVLRRSTTLATWASARAKPGLSMVRRMVVRYPENVGFPLVRSTLTEALGFGPNAYEPVRNEELPLRPCRAGQQISRATTARKKAVGTAAGKRPCWPRARRPHPSLKAVAPIHDMQAGEEQRRCGRRFPGSHVSRRGFMRTGVGVGAALLLPDLPVPLRWQARLRPTTTNRPAMPCSRPRLHASSALRRAGSPPFRQWRAHTTLRMRYAYRDLGGYRLYMRTYEGTAPRPDAPLKAGRRAAASSSSTTCLPTAILGRSTTACRMISTPRTFIPMACMSVRAASPTMSCA